MVRRFAILVLAAASMLSLSSLAQMRGGMGGGRGAVGGGMGGGRGAVGRGPAVSPRGPQAMPAARFNAPMSAHVIVNGGRFPGRVRPPFFNGRGCFGGFHCRNRFLFNTGFNFIPGLGWGLGYPYSGYYPGDYYQPQTQQPIVMSGGDEGANTQLAVEIQRLSDEIDSMRQEQIRQAQARPGASLSARSAAATTFVFRDGRRMTTENYAIAGQTLWLFSERAAKKFALADLDRGATEQVNADNGVDIRLPEVTP